jgi:hypothetical protein
VGVEGLKTPPPWRAEEGEEGQGSRAEGGGGVRRARRVPGHGAPRLPTTGPGGARCGRRRPAAAPPAQGSGGVGSWGWGGERGGVAPRAAGPRPRRARPRWCWPPAPAAPCPCLPWGPVVLAAGAAGLPLPGAAPAAWFSFTVVSCRPLPSPHRDRARLTRES